MGNGARCHTDDWRERHQPESEPFRDEEGCLVAQRDSRRMRIGSAVLVRPVTCVVTINDQSSIYVLSVSMWIWAGLRFMTCFLLMISTLERLSVGITGYTLH